MEKLLKKLGQKASVEQESKLIKDEKNKLEDDLRRVHREKAEEKEQYLKIQEEKIKLQS